MPHRASVYTIAISKKWRPKEVRPLGDIDGNGTYLADRISDYLAPGFAEANPETGKSVEGEAAAVEGHEVQVIVRTGETGFVADIHDKKGIHRLRQEATDSQYVRCASLFRLDRGQTLGWWAVHANHGRSAKALLQARVLDRFRQQHDDLTMHVNPCVDEGVLMEAIKNGRLNGITLTRFERPSDRSAASTDDWVKANDRGKLELRLTGDRGHHLKAATVGRFLKGDRTAYDDIVTFEDIAFEEAKVVVELTDGRERTFNLEKPGAGHAISRDLADSDLSFDGGEPTPKSLFSQLGAVIDDLS